MSDHFAMHAESPAHASEAFRRWFRQSKIVDAAGRPLVVFHGTASPSWTRLNTRNHFEPTNGMGHGAYFAPDIATAESYALMDSEVGDGDPAIIPVFLSLQNPKMLFGGMTSQSVSTAQKAQYEAEGYDGVIGASPDGREIFEIVAFDPRQIKSALCNRGSYDPANPDIRM